MTGFGAAREHDGRLNVTVEVRAVNNRYLKITTRSPDAYSPLESRIEKSVRKSIARGTVNVSIRVDQQHLDQPNQVNRTLLEGYWRQVDDIARDLNVTSPLSLGDMLMLPGVVEDAGVAFGDCETDWPVIERVLNKTLDSLREFRIEEGRSMQQELLANSKAIRCQLDEVAKAAPLVVSDYRERLHDRVRDVLQEIDISIESPTLIREVSIFAERCDINEEITRLGCHLEQFETFLNAETSMGRKLDFLSQEMFREINTIGSKANNVAIAHCVVEMKSCVEKIREILQNVE